MALVLDQSARPSRRAVALVLAALLTTFDLSINHFWSGFRYNDNIRYYFFEDLSIIGGLLLLATAGGGELSLDACRTCRRFQSVYAWLLHPTSPPGAPNPQAAPAL